jgi:hypothetical protein
MNNDFTGVTEECARQGIRVEYTQRPAKQLHEELPDYQEESRGFMEENTRRQNTIKRQGEFKAPRVQSSTQIAYPDGHRVTLDGLLTIWRTMNERNGDYELPVVVYHVPDSFTIEDELAWYFAINKNRDPFNVEQLFITRFIRGEARQGEQQSILLAHGAQVSSQKLRLETGNFSFKSIATLDWVYARGKFFSNGEDFTAGGALLNQVLDVTTGSFEHDQGFNTPFVRGVTAFFVHHPNANPQTLIAALKTYGTLLTLLDKSGRSVKGKSGDGEAVALACFFAYNKYAVKHRGDEEAPKVMRTSMKTPWGKTVAEARAKFM